MTALAGPYVIAFLGFALVLGACRSPVKQGDTIIVSGSEDGTQQVVQTETVVVADNSGLKKEISAIKDRLDLNEAMTRLLKETLALHEQRLTALEQKTQALETAFKIVSDKVNATQSSLTEINSKMATANQQLTATNLTRTQRQNLQAQVKELETQQVAMKAQLEQLLTRTAALEAFRAEQETWNTQFNEKVSSLTKSINSLDQGLSDVSFNVSLIDQSVDALTVSLLNLKDRIAFIESEQKRIINHMATDQELFDTKNEILATLRAELTNLSEGMAAGVDALYALIGSQDVCTAGEKYQSGTLWFVDLTCGANILKVMASL